MDIPLILGEIRPGADYGWRGVSASGAEAANYANVDWRDEEQTKPTTREIEDAWPAVQKKYFTDVADVATNREELIALLRTGNVEAANLQAIVADLLEGKD